MKMLACFFTVLLFLQVKAQQSVGIFQNEVQAFNGYTLFSNNSTTYLIDNCGFIVHIWQSDYPPGQSMYLLENGNLLRTAHVNGNFSAGGAGGRFELFNWDGDLLWSYQIVDENLHAHHDIAPLPNGNFLAIVWEKHSEAEAQQAGRVVEGEIWSEKIIEIEILPPSQVNIIWEWRLWDHLIQDKFSNKENFGVVKNNSRLVNINYPETASSQVTDWVHLNSIDYNSELDQIVVSARNFSEIWIIDHSTTTSEATSHSGGVYGHGGDLLYRYGNPQAYEAASSSEQQFFEQHDARWIPKDYPNAGKLMVFNNNALAQQSRVEIWSPLVDVDGNYQTEAEKFPVVATDWEYSALGFFSERRSGAQMLPNGNILICEGQTGEVFEVTPEKERVWRYINPVNRNGGPSAQGGTPRFNELFRATRYTLDYPAFEGKNLNPTVPVEINPWDLDCTIYDENVAVTAPNLIDIQLSYLPNEGILSINSPYPIQLQIFDARAQLWLTKKLNHNLTEVHVSDLPQGLYIATFWGKSGFIQSQKILKF